MKHKRMTEAKLWVVFFILGMVMTIMPSASLASEIDSAWYSCEYLEYSPSGARWATRQSGVCELGDRMRVEAQVSAWFWGETAVIAVNASSLESGYEYSLRLPRSVPFLTTERSRRARLFLKPVPWAVETMEYQTLEVTLTPVSNYYGQAGEPYTLYASFHVPMPPVLNVALDSSLLPVVVEPGVAEVAVARYKLSAGTGGDVTVNVMTFDLRGANATCPLVQNLSLWVNAVQLADVVTMGKGCQAVFNELGLVVARANTAELTLRLDVAQTAETPDVVRVDLSNIVAGAAVWGLPVMSQFSICAAGGPCSGGGGGPGSILF